MDRLIFEEAQNMIKRLDDTLQNGRFDRQTGKDIDMAKVQIHELIGWLRVANREYAELEQSWQRLATEVNLLREKLS